MKSSKVVLRAKLVAMRLFIFYASAASGVNVFVHIIRKSVVLDTFCILLPARLTRMMITENRTRKTYLHCFDIRSDIGHWPVTRKYGAVSLLVQM